MKPVAKDEQNIKNRIAEMYGNKDVPTCEAIAKSLGKKLKSGVIDQTLHDKAINQLNGTVEKGDDGELEKAHKYVSRSGSKGHYKYVYREHGEKPATKHFDVGDHVMTPFSGTIVVSKVEGNVIWDHNGRRISGFQLKDAEIIGSPEARRRKSQTIQDAHNAKIKAEKRERQANKMTEAKYNAAIKEWASSLAHDLGDEAMENVGETVENFILAHPNVVDYIENRNTYGYDNDPPELRIQWDLEGQL